MNSTACKALLEDLVARGVRSDRALRVVIEGSKALAKAVCAVFGERALVQWCLVHTKRNLTDPLPDDVARRIGATISADAQWRTRLPSVLRTSGRTRSTLMAALSKKSEVVEETP